MMHDVIYTTGPDFGFILLWILHAAGMIAALIGGLLLILWAIKTLTPAQMRHWGLWLLLAGVAACLLTLVFLPMQRIHTGGVMSRTSVYSASDENNIPYMMKGGMMDDDGMGMSMNGMSMMLSGKTGDAFDEAFIRMMIPHHQGAIDMANEALNNAKHDEMKKLATDIITSQQGEIDMMKRWEKDWGYSN